MAALVTVRSVAGATLLGPERFPPGTTAAVLFDRVGDGQDVVRVPDHFTAQEGFIQRGDDIEVATMTVEQAEAHALTLPHCAGFCFRGPVPSPGANIEVHFKSKCDIQGKGWTSYRRSTVVVRSYRLLLGAQELKRSDVLEGEGLEISAVAEASVLEDEERVRLLAWARSDYRRTGLYKTLSQLPLAARMDWAVMMALIDCEEEHECVRRDEGLRCVLERVGEHLGAFQGEFALRACHPGLLANRWFIMCTLQHHRSLPWAKLVLGIAATELRRDGAVLERACSVAGPAMLEAVPAEFRTEPGMVSTVSKLKQEAYDEMMHGDALQADHVMFGQRFLPACSLRAREAST